MDESNGIVVHQAVEQPKPTPKKKRTLEDIIDETVSDYSGVQIEEVRYLYFPWFIRGKICLLQADTDTGKSTFMYCVGAYVTQGLSIYGIPCEAPGNVMFCTSEDSESDILTAFRDSGGDESRLRKIDRETLARLNFGNVKDIAYIEGIIRKHDLKLLVFDPVQAFLNGDMNKASETRPQLAKIAKIADETGCCIFFIQHEGKDKNRKGIHRGIGSVDIPAAGRSLLQAIVDPEDEQYRIIYTLKNNTAARSDTQQAIRYKIVDHPGSFDEATGKYRHFHGHAELTGIIPKYTETIYRHKLAKAENEQSELQLSVNYESEPLVMILREIIKWNPQAEGLFFRSSDIISLITRKFGKCPYTTDADKVTGLKSRIRKLRDMLMEKDHIQVDILTGSRKPKPYVWDGKAVDVSGESGGQGFTVTKI